MAKDNTVDLFPPLLACHLHGKNRVVVYFSVLDEIVEDVVDNVGKVVGIDNDPWMAH
jgi:hypothetical protein